MPEYEYKVIPAPAKGVKAKGVKSPEGRFAHALELMMNEMAGDGWEYLRADMLPSEERQGLTGSTTNWRNVLVFRRTRAGSLEDFQPQIIPAVAAPEPPLHTSPETAESEEVDAPPEYVSRREPPLRLDDAQASSDTAAPESDPQPDTDPEPADEADPELSDDTQNGKDR